jgi:hypothetical protein
MVIDKQIQPVSYMLELTVLQPTGKIAIETFSSVFYILCSSFDYAFLFFAKKENEDDALVSRIYMSLDTMYHHLWKHNVSDVSLLHRR